LLGLAGDVFRQEQPGVIALGLADALRQEEIEKRKKLAKFADRIARIRQADFELFQQIEQFHGLSLGSELPEPSPRSPSIVVQREPQVRPIVLRDGVGFIFAGKSEEAAADPAKKIVLAPTGKGNSWGSLSALSIELAAANRRAVRRRKGGIGGGGIEEEEPAELRVTEDDETRVTEDGEERVVE